MRTSEEWQELRSFEREAPTLIAFRALLGLLEAWSGDDFEDAFIEAERLLEAWPDEIRRAPWSLAKAVTKGHSVRAWPLVRSVALSSRSATKSAVSLAKLCESGHGTELREVILPSYTDHPDISYLHHRPTALPKLERLVASDQEASLSHLAGHTMWGRMRAFSIGPLRSSLLHGDATRIVPELPPDNRLEEITLHAGDLVQMLEASEAPALRRVSVYIRSEDEARAMASRPELAEVEALTLAFRCGFCGRAPAEPFLGNVIEPDEVAARAFFERASLPALRELHIVGYRAGYWGREGLGPSGLDGLVESGVLGRLTKLHLELLPLGDAGIARIAPHLNDGLEALELLDVYCKTLGLEALLSRTFPALERLNLGANRIDARGVAALAAAELPSLLELNLSGPNVQPYYFDVGDQPVGDEGVSHLTQSGFVSRLRVLGLRNTFVADEGIGRLFSCPDLSLEHLYLSHNALSADALGATRGSSLWTSLRRLTLENCRLGDTAIERLVQASGPASLRALHLAFNSIGPRGARALANWEGAKSLWSLTLHDNHIGDEGLVALSESPNLSRLIELDLEQDCWNTQAFNFSDEAAHALAQSKTLRRMDAIYSGCIDGYHGAASSPGFSREGLRALVRAPHLGPGARACAGSFEDVSDWTPSPPYGPADSLSERDFRRHERQPNTEEAEVGQVALQMVGSEGRRRALPIEAFDAIPTELDDPLSLLGLEGVTPLPRTDRHLDLSVSFRPPAPDFPVAAAAMLAQTLDRTLRAMDRGSCEVAGGMMDAEGRTIEQRLRVGLANPVEPAIAHIVHVLGWMGMRERVVLSEWTDAGTTRFPLDSSEPEGDARANLVQLSTMKASALDAEGKRYCIDRPPFVSAQTYTLEQVLHEAGVPKDALASRSRLELPDGGALVVHARGLGVSPDFDTLCLSIEAPSASVYGLVHRCMRDAGLVLLPMGLVASAEHAEFDFPWPRLEVVTSPEALRHRLETGMPAP